MTTAPPSPQVIVFTGSMDWRPNQDAVEYFADDLLPILKQRDSSIESTFVGRNPPEHIVRRDGVGGVHITGTVDDVRPYIEEAGVYIVPLRIGGGSRLKILEALAMQKPVVSTSVGAEGLEVTDGQDILIADTPSEFADQVMRLFDNPDLARQLGQRGRELVEKRYGWDSLADKLSRYLIDLTEQR